MTEFYTLGRYSLIGSVLLLSIKYTFSADTAKKRHNLLLNLYNV
jgi:hypothetical protein